MLVRDRLNLPRTVPGFLTGGHFLDAICHWVGLLLSGAETSRGIQGTCEA